MKVLGLGTEGDSGAVVVEDGRILSAVSEERILRMKLVHGFPWKTIPLALELAGIKAAELDAVLVAAERDHLTLEPQPFDGWFEGMEGNRAGFRKRLAGALAPYQRFIPFSEQAYYLVQAPGFRKRRDGIRRIMREEYGIRGPLEFVDHHFAHLTSAYYTSGFGDALVVSVDGGGDAKSSRVYEVRDGRWKELSETSAFNSLGNYYAYVTHLCGFKAQKHEGKITGLAAYGEPRYVPLLKEFIDTRDGRLVNHGRVAFHAALDKLRAGLPADWTREDLAASIQRHFEDVTSRFVQHWARETGLRDVAVAGGVFANVRVNQVVHELPEIDRIFVHPAMSDGGLPGGAALAACVPGVLPETMARDSEPLRDVYLGPSLDERAIDRALSDQGLKHELLERPLAEEIAHLLAEGYVVVRATGRMEYGPRALGHRSILYQPSDPKVNDWLNQNLRRTEFMPFAPATLWEERERCFEKVEGAEHTAEFMTITFNCTPWMQEHMAGVVHIDGTARPQLVRKDRNPDLHAVISAFHDLTGLPAVINTSFNMHEEPIVCSADDAVRAFLDGNLEYLAIGDRLVKHPRGVERELVPVQHLADETTRRGSRSTAPSLRTDSRSRRAAPR
ncbi:MAG: carbamoyltransferase C-terminal domain-containing protein [Gemmatimonadota bacterium]